MGGEGMVWTREAVAQFAGISYSQLYHWERGLGLVKGESEQRGLSGGGYGGRLYVYPPREVLNVLVIAALRRAGVSLQRIRKGIAWLRDHLDLERPLEEAIFLAGTAGEIYAVAYTSEEFRDRLFDVAQRQGQTAMASVLLGRLWTRIVEYEATEEETKRRDAIAVA